MILSLAHFTVDFACAFLAGTMADQNLAVAIIIYNFCAFAMQMPLGVFVEGRFPPLKTAGVGMVAVLFAFLLSDFPAVALLIAGLGNALFHLGGGLSVMSASEKAAPLGVFIAPGAFGIYFGAILDFTWALPILILVAVLAFLLWRKKDHTAFVRFDAKSVQFKGRYFVIAAMFLVVVLRGFVGLAQVFPWKSQWSLLFVTAVVLGKAIGGFLSDRFGAGIVGAVSLALSGLCFLFPQSPVFGIAGVFLFQMTMPITLWVVCKLTAKGLGFGLLTFGLFLGSIPIFIDYSVKAPLIILVAATLAIFTLGMRVRAKKWPF